MRKTAFTYQPVAACLQLQGVWLQTAVSAKLFKKLAQLKPQCLDFSEVTALDTTVLALVLFWQQQAPTPLRLQAVPPSFWAMARAHGVEALLKNKTIS